MFSNLYAGSSYHEDGPLPLVTESLAFSPHLRKETIIVLKFNTKTKSSELFGSFSYVNYLFISLDQNKQ